MKHLRSSAALIAVVTAALGCNDKITTGVEVPDVAHVRIVNSLYQGPSASATPVAIDYLIDGSTNPPGVAGLSGNALTSTGTATNYKDVSVGVHSFMARIAGRSSTTDSLYTTTTNLPWVPRQYLTSNAYYTIIVAGLIPASGPINNNTVPFVTVVDDPFPPIKGTNGQYLARFRVINAAPYGAASGNGTALSVYITPGATPPASLSTISSLGTATYRNASPYLNVDPGVYTLTISFGPITILSQSTVTFAAGEVRTFIIQSTGPGAPGVANHKLTSILDQAY